MREALLRFGDGQVTNIGGVVATDNAFLSVGFSLDAERLSSYCRDGASNDDRRGGLRKAHGQKSVDRGYPLTSQVDWYPKPLPLEHI